jgi:serine O-acetyltransferase
MNKGESPPGVSAEVPDWSRAEKRAFSWNPSKALLATIRSYQRHAESRNPLRVLVKKWAVLRYRFWSVLTGVNIPLGCKIGGGLLLPHPNGIVIHSGVQIGPNCLIFLQVTIGVTAAGQTPPVIGGHVDIGAGAKILRDLRIGDHHLIGANAVAFKDVPAGKTATSCLLDEVE